MPFEVCAVIPTYDNPATIRSVIEAVSVHLPIVVIDDGSGHEGRAAVLAAGKFPGVTVKIREKNGGKGAAVTTGLDLARQLGYTHALQIDADGQHAISDIPGFLAQARARPQALILGSPRYDDSAPLARLIGRRITRFWTNVETMGRVIDDPMCGFRVYPLDATCPVAPRCGRRMEFDIEVAVRLVWQGCSVVNQPTLVQYPSDGISHFSLFADNMRISGMHARLSVEGVLRAAERRLTSVRRGERLPAVPGQLENGGYDR